MAGDKDERIKLGVFNQTEYFYNYTQARIEWRIPDIREAVHAEPGHLIVASDFSQIEVKIMAYLSQDPWLISAINSGKDIHCFMAVDVFGARDGFDYDLINLARKDENHPRHAELNGRRDQIKAVTFGVSYGAGAFRIHLITGLDIPFCQELIERYFQKAIVLKRYLDKVGTDAIHFGYSASPLGRRRFYTLPRVDDPDLEEKVAQIKRWAGNQPIQSGSADMLKHAVKLIYQGLRAMKLSYEDARILFVLHDEIVMTAREDLVPAIKALMEDSMTKAYNLLIQGVANTVKVVTAEVWEKAA